MCLFVCVSHLSVVDVGKLQNVRAVNVSWPEYSKSAARRAAHDLAKHQKIHLGPASVTYRYWVIKEVSSAPRRAAQGLVLSNKKTYL